MKIVCVNGEFVVEDEAKISVLDELVLGGIGVYETMRTYGGRVWQIERHLERLTRSAAALRIESGFSTVKITELVRQTVERNKFAEARIRVTLSKGAGSAYGGDFGSRLVIVVADLSEEIEETELMRKDGVSLVLCRMERFLPQVKSCNLLPAYLAQMEAREAKAHEALLVNGKGEITEGAVTNVFFVKGGVLITPAEGILLGTTRDLLIELAESADIRVEERSVKVSKLKEMQQCFICNAIKGIVPVREVLGKEGAKFNIGGGVTGRLRGLYLKEIERFIGQ